MIKWLVKIFSNKKVFEDKTFPYPWKRERTGLFRFILPYAEGNGALPESTQTLPDENISDGEIRWSAGALDGTLGHHGSNSSPEIAENLLKAFCRAAKQPSKKNIESLYEQLNQESTLSYIDILMEKIPSESSLHQQNFHDLLVWLASESPDRNPVKCAISLLSYFPSAKNQSLVYTLGLHEEFTLYSAFALCNMVSADKLEDVLLDLAKRVEGWGRIELIYRLPNELSDTSRDWLLRHGYSNHVMPEYTAWDCATKGKLLSAISSKSDNELLIGASSILEALIFGGPAKDIYDYTDGAQTCLRYIKLVKESTDDELRFLLTSNVINEFVSDKDRDWEVLLSFGWNDEIRQQINDDYQVIVSNPKWCNKVNRDLSSNDTQNNYISVRAARVLGIDPWDALFKLQSESVDKNYWYELMQTDDSERVKKVITLAEIQLDLNKIATGPDTQLGLGPEYQMHSGLDFILQDLKHFPGLGMNLIMTGLRSPVIRNRHMSLNALTNWPPEQRSNELRQQLTMAYEQEPDNKLRNRLETILTEWN